MNEFKFILHKIVSGGEAMRLSRSVMQEIVGAFPGIDEAMSYAEVMKLVMNYLIIYYIKYNLLSNNAQHII